MSILFHCPWHNNKEWLEVIKKQFKNKKIYILKDKPDLSKIECAIIWNISNHTLSKMSNVKILFSLGAGVDHITELKSYRGQPIIRLKDPFMAERMTNHILSQILRLAHFRKDRIPIIIQFIKTSFVHNSPLF